MKFDWEDIFFRAKGKTVEFNTARAKVEGGWLIAHVTRYKDELTSCMSFIPDIKHKWEIEKNEI